MKQKSESVIPNPSNWVALTVDGCFILMLFIYFQLDLNEREYYNPLYELDSVILSKICGDLLLLKNQIPSFILEEVYRICFDYG